MLHIVAGADRSSTTGVLTSVPYVATAGTPAVTPGTDGMGRPVRQLAPDSGHYASDAVFPATTLSANGTSATWDGTTGGSEKAGSLTA